MALSSMGCLSMMLILVVLGAVQGGRPGFPELGHEAADQSGKGERVDPYLFYYTYKAADQSGKGERVDPNLFYYTYKAADQSGKGERVDPNLFYYTYKAADQSGKGEKVDSNSTFLSEAEDQLAKPASNHKADEAVSNQETKLDSPSFGAFLKTDLVEGATFRLVEVPSTRNKAFLPETVADELPPLTVGSFPELLRVFNIQEGSDMYAAMESAIRVCDQSSSLPGEERMCATSFESLLDVVSSLVGLDVKILTNSARPRMDMGPMKMNNFTQHSVQNGKNLACHTVVFPSLLYGCHVAPDTEVVEASLTDAAGLVIRAIGVCHLDTKMWDPEHILFKVLGVKPGTTVCHWLGSDDMVWVSTKMKKSSVIHEASPHGEHMA